MKCLPRKDVPISTMTDAQMEFIGELGVLFESSGAQAVNGRIYGALLVSHEIELTAEELATTLHASRGAISQGTRQLVDMGLLRRTHKPGMRKDFFQLTPDGLVEATRLRIANISSIKHLFERGLNALEDASPQARASLKENLEFLEYWDEFMVEFFNGWKERKKHDNG